MYVYICIRKYGYNKIHQNNKKKKIKHAHSLETVVERDSVHIETNKHHTCLFL